MGEPKSSLWGRSVTARIKCYVVKRVRWENRQVCQSQNLDFGFIFSSYYKNILSAQVQFRNRLW